MRKAHGRCHNQARNNDQNQQKNRSALHRQQSNPPRPLVRYWISRMQKRRDSRSVVVALTGMRGVPGSRRRADNDGVFVGGHRVLYVRRNVQKCPNGIGL